MAPVIERVGFGDEAVAEHSAMHAPVRLEDTAAQEDVGETEHGDSQEAQVMQEQHDAVDACAEIEHGGVEQQDDARNAHQGAEEPQHAVGETLAALDLALVGHVDEARHEQVREEQDHPLLVV